MATRVIGMDLGVTSASEVVVAQGVSVERAFRAPSTPEGLTRAIRRAAGGEPVNLVLESTAMAWFVAGVAAGKSGVEHTLYRVSGRKAAALRDFYRFHTKTDRIDARVLARMPLLDDALRQFRLPSQGELALKRLVTLRAKLVRDATRLRGRLRSTLHWAAPGLLGKRAVTDGVVALLSRWPNLQRLAAARTSTVAREAGIDQEQAEAIRRAAREAVSFYADRVDFNMLALEITLTTGHLKLLQNQQRQLENQIQALHTSQYPEDPLLTLPGVGSATAAVIRATVGDAGSFTNLAAFKAYTGLVPRENSSGEAKRRGRISKAGPNQLRAALYLAADSARRNDPELASLYRRLLLERGHHHTQAVCAVATHLTARIWAVLRERRPYQPRDLDGHPITQQQARILALDLAIDPDTRQQLKTGKGGPGAPSSRQPKAPHGATRPSRTQLTDTALELARKA